MSLSIFSNFGLTSGSAFSPADIPGLTLWLDASDISTITESGGSVSQWDDKSGNGYDVTQATAALQPTTGTRTINSLNAIDFDGSEAMASATSFASPIAQPYMTFIVFQADVVAGYLTDGNNASYRMVNLFVSSKYRLYAGDPNTWISTTNADTNAHIWTSYYDSTAPAIIIDDVTLTATGGISTDSTTGITIGNRYSFDNTFFNGMVAEILLFDSILSSSQEDEVHQYLSSKWGITI